MGTLALILGIVDKALDIIDIKLRRKYEEQKLSLLKAYNEEDNKPVWDGKSQDDPFKYRSNAVLVNIEYELLVLANTVLTEAAKPRV
jgi:hypothetical protein